jgi:indole-3-glycerol phosphate synthase
MSKDPDILSKIAAYKRHEVAAAKAIRPLRAEARAADEAPPPRGFRAALDEARRAKRPGLIAEIKKASPSKGIIREDFDPPRLAREYERGGATCLSVLTDGPSFQGASDDLPAVRTASTLPVLRKDFMIDPYQIVQSRALGADCILVIFAMVADRMAKKLLDAASEWQMDALAEIHDEHELERALGLGAELIGINNRNLRTFTTDIETSLKLKPLIPPECHVVAESGLATSNDLMRLAGAGITSFLIGESLMRKADLEAATHELLDGVQL